MFNILLISILGIFGNSDKVEIDKLNESSIALLDSDLSKARSIAVKSLELAEESNYVEGEAQSLFILAYCDASSNKLNMAVPEYFRSLELYRKIETEKSTLCQAKILMNLGKIFRAHYKYNDAINFYKEGYEKANALGDVRLMSNILHNMSIAYRHKGDLVEAAEIQFQKLNLQDANNTKEKIKSYNQLGLVHKDLNDFDQSRNYFEHIINLERNKTKSTNRARALNNIGICYYLEKKYDEAEKYYLMSMNESEEIGKSIDVFNSYLNLSEIYIEKLDFKNAEKYTLAAHRLLDNVPSSIENNKINHYLSQIYFATNQPEKAKIYSDKYVEQMEALYDQQRQLAAQGDQYKIELITSTYFAKIQEQEKFNYYILGVVALVSLFVAFFIYHRYRKVAAAKMLREHFSSISFNISNTSK